MNESNVVWIWVICAVVLIGMPIALLLYTNVAYGPGPIDWSITFFGVASFLGGLWIAAFKVYPIYKMVEGVREGE